MSGARLQNIGQVREVIPYAVNQGFNIRLALTVANNFYDRQPITFTGNLPFDLGPDKGGRVFLVINGIHVSFRANAGTTSALRGALFFQGLDGRRIYLASFMQTLTTGGDVITNFGSIMPAQSVNSDQLSPLGFIGFEDALPTGSTIGTATALDLSVWLNIGFYTDYAEDDLEKYIQTFLNHEHIGLPLESVS